MPAVLALGLDPAFVDPKAMGGLSPAIVRAFIDAQLDRVRVLGYELESCLVDLGATAGATVGVIYSFSEACLRGSRPSRATDGLRMFA